MSIEEWAVWLVRVAAITQTLFVLIYGFGSPWWVSRIGRAVFIKALALGLLLDLSLLNQWIGHPYPHMEQIALAVIALVTVGSTMQLSALLVERFRPTPNDGFGSRQKGDGDGPPGSRTRQAAR